ncbi:alpha-2-macroglobulin family protein [Flaviaesturariibacter amylovorans]|uniref:Alpha-2-macroglobulin family protein n=1 Tax=Flaviaesturariibacter amylovorans TaxID=1084520 RepID=A0ABP8HT03_9BACT
MQLRSLILLTSLLLLGSAHVDAQTKQWYDRQWEKADSLSAIAGKPRSALEVVNSVYKSARAQNNEAQLIRALVYRTGLREGTREQGAALGIRELEAERKGLRGTALALVNSLLARTYRTYTSHHHWQIRNRTATGITNEKDITTWTLRDLHERITGLYEASLSERALLQRTALTAYAPLIRTGNSRALRPTLYDLLAHEALDYFKSGEADLARPERPFAIAQPEALAPASEFARARFATTDSASLQWRALRLFQDLITFHLQRGDAAALADVDLDRIAYAYEHSVHPDKEALYVATLRQLMAQRPGRESHGAAYLLAQHHEEKAGSYDPLKDSSGRWERNKAIALLEPVVRDSAVKSAAWVMSYNLLQQLRRPSFSMEAEKVNVPGAPFRVLVNYRSVPKLYLRAIALKDTSSLSLNDAASWAALLRRPAAATWEQELPATGDAQTHRVEVPAPALAVGRYLLLASTEPTFRAATTLASGVDVLVSNISHVRRGEALYVLHRVTGRPLPGAVVRTVYHEYNNRRQEYEYRNGPVLTADNRGQVQLRTGNRQRQLYFKVLHGRDSLFLVDGNDGYYEFDPGKPEPQKERTEVSFFTDRAIYRPGQTVFFKGLVVRRLNGVRVGASSSSTVFLRDANGQVKDSVRLTTNDYGSFHGRFTLPATGLTGRFSIGTEGGETSFSVEEYKRPKFYVEFAEQRGSYRVGDSVRAEGTAQAYAGNTIGDARVTYRVVRAPRRVWSWWWRWMPQGTEQEITHGETTTDAAGRFRINFTALPDGTLDSASNPVFDYTVYADVTDINGETRSGEQTLAASYRSLLLSFEGKEREHADSFARVPVQATNINGTPQRVRASVSIRKLRPEPRLVRARYWERPDQFVLSKEAFLRLFPLDEYAGESDFRTWTRDSIVWQGTDTIGTDRMGLASTGMSLGGKRLQPGFYEIEVRSADSAGRPVTATTFVELYRPGTLTRPEYLWAAGPDTALEPGQQGSVQLGSATDIHLFRNELRGDSSRVTTQELPAGVRSFPFPIAETDRGGFTLHFLFVRDNRLYEHTQRVTVPWTNKELRVVYATYRNKTLPGAKEEWKLTITRADGRPVGAEVLASLYDASLDQFQKHRWSVPGLYPDSYSETRWDAGSNFRAEESFERGPELAEREFNKTYDGLIFDILGTGAFLSIHSGRVMRMARPPAAQAAMGSAAMDSYGYNTTTAAAVRYNTAEKVEMTKFTPPKILKDEEVRKEPVPPAQGTTPTVQPRRNFNETAFFYPQLQTDSAGGLSLTFTLPESLTRWKLQTLAHTKDLAFGLGVEELETQKDLMVQTNAPRFVRQGDHFEFTTKIANLTDKELTGQVQLELIDAATGTPVDGWMQNVFPNQYFTVAAGASSSVAFPIEIPYLYTSALTWRITARAGNFSDAEESTLPVLSSKVLVTESLPVSMRGSGSKTFRFDKLLASGNSETLQHKGFTVEYTANPAWTVVQALPYLVEYPYECAEQLWNRYYANTLAAHILQKAPKIRAALSRWQSRDTAALLSNLQKNEELKSALLEETPWVLEAQNETQQRRSIALLFDLTRLAAGQRKALEQLAAAQNATGAFPWFSRGPDDRYITQYILAGIGRLQQLGISSDELTGIRDRALNYVDRRVRDDYAALQRSKAKLAEQPVSRHIAQYLYLRSFFKTRPLFKGSEAAHAYYLKQAARYWQKLPKISQGHAAIALQRYGVPAAARTIIGSLNETAIRSEELGMYWKDNSYGQSPYWYEAPIETQATLIAAFQEVGADARTLDDLRSWLLRHKQTNSWRSTTATADACYALLLQGTEWLSDVPSVTIQAGPLRASTDTSAEAGTGYFRRSVDGAQVKPAMGNISVDVRAANAVSARPSWGAVHWQYFEEISKVTRAATPLQVERRLFRKVNTDRGPELRAVGSETLHVGDKVTVRLVIRVDRDLEFVHLKDLRASALEPVNVLSSYKWQDGLGYYESTRDASTNFFFHWLPKGTYVFEYPLFVTHKGQFSAGLTTIQCLYAPEFNAHSEGQQLTVE